MFLLIALTGTYFVSTGVQFWITDYFQIVLDVSKENAFIYYAIAAMTGPVSGIIIGGYVFNSLGGYTHPKALPVAILVMAIGCCCGFPACFSDNFLIVISLLWV